MALNCKLDKSLVKVQRRQLPWTLGWGLRTSPTLCRISARDPVCFHLYHWVSLLKAPHNHLVNLSLHRDYNGTPVWCLHLHMHAAASKMREVCLKHWLLASFLHLKILNQTDMLCRHLFWLLNLGSKSKRSIKNIPLISEETTCLDPADKISGGWWISGYSKAVNNRIFWKSIPKRKPGL